MGRIAQSENPHAEPNYYSKQLQHKLNKLSFSSTSVVEAPSGYGKTTAVQDFFKTKLSPTTPIFWFTAVDEPCANGFRRLCYKISQIDTSAGIRLLRIGLPNSVTVGEACDALRSVCCVQDTYLVLDNFQFLQTALMPSFLHTILDHGVDKLHIVLITQVLTWDMQAAVIGRRCLHITTKDLRLDTKNIQNYYAQVGVQVSLAEAMRIEKHTEGWIIAVYLQLCALQRTGKFSETDIMPLMEHLVWGMMTKEQQLFLMRLSPFDAITKQQACRLMGCDKLPSYALQVLQNQFIRCESPQQRYEIHTILRKLLQQKRWEQGAAFENECLLNAGDLCAGEGRIIEALGFYWHLKDYQRILSLDVSPCIFEEITGKSFVAIALEVAQNCPSDIKMKNPLSMLHIAWTLLIFGYRSDFVKLMDELREIIDSPGSQNVLLTGEWLLLYSFHGYPDLAAMTATLKKADLIFNGKHSQVIFPEMTVWFDPLANFHIKPGEADQEADDLDEYIGLLTKLTNGCGCGAADLYRATLAYYRGNNDEAEIFAYKAAYQAENKRQSIIQIGAAVILADVALHKADTKAWQRVITSMERAASHPCQNSFVIRSAIDIACGVLFVEQRQSDRLADWLKTGDFSKKRVLPTMKPLAVYVHGMYLLHQGETGRLIGMLEANKSCALMEMPFNNMLITLTLAAGYFHINNEKKAMELISGTARTVMPDKMIVAFASFSQLLNGLTDRVVAKEYPHCYHLFETVKNRFESGWTKLYQEMMASEKLSANLTNREREVALLAARGLRNSEIAKELYISENTVRSHLRTVFKKLKVDRRTKLAGKLK